jgi:hypothetical protein
MNTYGFPYKADIVAKVNDVEVARASSWILNILK